jgi:predicted glycosyltransferase
MRILVDILHPKQAHFFRPLIIKWRERGDVVHIVTRDKDITHQLLDGFGFTYECLSRQGDSSLWMELVQRWIKMVKVIRVFRPDLTMSVTGISTALPSRLLGVPNIAFTDTETATISNKIAFPFADRILTPDWFLEDFGTRHYRYKGFHEWSYLHPQEFQPDPAIVHMEGLDPNLPYAVLRFVRWDAVHDQGEMGLRKNEAIDLVEQLSKQMKVVISSETPLPPEIQKYELKIDVQHMHHILAFSRLVVGESPSMSTEAAILGVPSVLISTWAGRVGNMQVLERKYSLMRVFERAVDAVPVILSIGQSLPSQEKILTNRASLIDTLEYIPDMVEKHLLALLEKNG